jgi:hypothetical protein
VIRFYFHPTPNPAKVALFLEEASLPYEMLPVDTSKGEQHLPAFRKINPNGKVPAIVDTEGPGGKEVRIFDSSAILLYLGEKTRRFLGRRKIDPNCCPGFSSSPQGWARSPVRPCTSRTPHRMVWTMRAIATDGRRNAIIRFSKTNSRA